MKGNSGNRWLEFSISVMAHVLAIIIASLILYWLATLLPGISH